MRRIALILVIAILIFGLLPGQTHALSAAQTQVFQEGVYGFNTELDNCTGSSINVSTFGSGSGTWQSGLTPPYILEQFAIETLKDVASKAGVPSTDAVTQEHVIALVAFMFGEGGDINNNDLFNPLNTGINAPDLLATSNAANGVQSFKSFDAGVEATARTITGSNQSRLAAVLVQPASSAEQFMQALTYFQNYAGNKFWAAASLPPNQDSYYKQRLILIQEVRNNYANIAGLVLGTPAKEFINNTTDKAKLQFNPTSGSGSPVGTAATSTGGVCVGSGGSGVVAGNIVKTALGLAWPNQGHGNQQADATTAYQQAMPTYNGSTGELPYSDCGVFVATVMVASGADKNYPKRGTGIQLSYLQSSGKYQILNNVNSTAGLLPGDILIFNNGAEGHTYIYTGPYKGSDGATYNAAAASLTQHVPQADYAYFTQAGNHFTVARLKGN